MVVHSPRPSLVCPLSATFPVARSLVRSRPEGRKGKEERKYTTHIYDNMGGKQGNKRDSVILVGGRGFHFSVDVQQKENKQQLFSKCSYDRTTYEITSHFCKQRKIEKDLSLVQSQ